MKASSIPSDSSRDSTCMPPTYSSAIDSMPKMRVLTLEKIIFSFSVFTSRFWVSAIRLRQLDTRHGVMPYCLMGTTARIDSRKYEFSRPNSTIRSSEASRSGR